MKLVNDPIEIEHTIEYTPYIETNSWKCSCGIKGNDIHTDLQRHLYGVQRRMALILSYLYELVNTEDPPTAQYLISEIKRVIKK